MIAIHFEVEQDCSSLLEKLSAYVKKVCSF